MNIFRIFLLSISLFFSVHSNQDDFKEHGTQDVCPQLMEEARAVFRKIGLKNAETIPVKRIKTEIIERYKKAKEKDKTVSVTAAFATAFGVFVDEEHLLSLTKEERLFIWGHEATHVKNNDALRYAMVFGSAVAGGVGGVLIAVTCSIPAGLALLGGSILAPQAFERHYEAQADAGGNLVGSRVFFRDHSHLKDLSRAQKIKVWLKSWFDSFHGESWPADAGFTTLL